MSLSYTIVQKRGTGFKALHHLDKAFSYLVGENRLIWLAKNRTGGPKTEQEKNFG